MPTTSNLDATYVYWADEGNGEVRRVPKDGGATETLIGGLGAPRGVAVDAAAVYYTDAATGVVGRIPL